MTVPEIDTLCWSSVAYSRRVARFPAGEAATQPGQELARRQEWPLRSYLELRALPASVRCARLHAKNILCEWRVGALTDTVELLVSEIITNAVRASANIGNRPTGTGQAEASQSPRAPWIRFWLTSDRHSVLIQVWDGNRHHPIPQNAGPDAEAGRGLLLVETLSAEWGCYEPGGQGGKIVWAVCAQ
jgi:anti-sigma regulatory factor (Ser/Thr protein kinase)